MGDQPQQAISAVAQGKSPMYSTADIPSPDSSEDDQQKNPLRSALKLQRIVGQDAANVDISGLGTDTVDTHAKTKTVSFAPDVQSVETSYRPRTTYKRCHRKYKPGMYAPPPGGYLNTSKPPVSLQEHLEMARAAKRQAAVSTTSSTRARPAKIDDADLSLNKLFSSEDEVDEMTGLISDPAPSSIPDTNVWDDAIAVLHSERPLCPQCRVNFQVRSSLEKHVERNHPGCELVFQDDEETCENHVRNHGSAVRHGKRSAPRQWIILRRKN